jgi:Predicted periplasmic protein (DUF2092)
MLAALIAIDGKAVGAEAVTVPSNQTTTTTPISATSKKPPPASQPQTAHPRVDPKAEQLLRDACWTLAHAKAFTFHAEINFDQVLQPTPVKLRFAAAADYAVKKPYRLAVDYASDLGAKPFRMTVPPLRFRWRAHDEHRHLYAEPDNNSSTRTMSINNPHIDNLCEGCCYGGYNDNGCGATSVQRWAEWRLKLTSLPRDDALVYTLGPTPYYYSNGNYVTRAASGGHQVVGSSLGAMVTEVLPGAYQTTLNGITYYASGSTYYESAFSNGQVVFKVATIDSWVANTEIGKHYLLCNMLSALVAGRLIAGKSGVETGEGAETRRRKTHCRKH